MPDAPGLWRGSLRNREHRARAGYMPGTWACRNCGSSRLRPLQNGQHTSWNSPSERLAAPLIAERGNSHGKDFDFPAEAIGAVLLAWSRWAGAVGAAGGFARRGLRDSAFRSGGQLVVFVQTGLNFVDDAQVADKLGGVRIGEVRLAVRIAINGSGRKVRELWLAPREAGSGEKNQQRGRDRDGAVREAGRSQTAEPAESTAPALFCFAWPKSLIKDGVDQLRRRLDLLQRVQSAEQMRNAGDHLRAVFAGARVQGELAALVGAEKTVEIVAQVCFNMFASPGHEMLRATSAAQERIMMGALPFAAGCALVRFVRG